MLTIGTKLGSHRFAIVEALTMHDRTGLTIPDIVKVSQVPHSTVHRIIEDFSERGIVRSIRKKGKARVFRLDSRDPQIVEVVRAVRRYIVAVAELEAQRHGVNLAIAPAKHEGHVVVVHLDENGWRKRIRADRDSVSTTLSVELESVGR